MSEECLLRLDFARPDLPLVRAMVAESLFRAGVNELLRGRFVQAALEIACNAVVHGGGSGRLMLTVADGELRCEVTDRGPGLRDDVPSHGARPNGRDHGLLLAETLTGRLELRRGPGGRGTTAALAVRLEAVPN